MSLDVLAHALQFGGSERFGDRSGLGRFGMGLPNSSLSQARRVEVYTWKTRSDIRQAILDLDVVLSSSKANVAEGSVGVLPPPARSPLPSPFTRCRFPSGTLVIWRRLDRTAAVGRRWADVSARLEQFIGQVFRFFLWNGVTIEVDGRRVSPTDPLFLRRSPDTLSSSWSAALPYGPVMKYEVAGEGGIHGTIEVRFTEISVANLANRTNPEKRALGIVNRAGVSVVRAEREIDYGWFFFDKRRENYDDWWRCEIQFPPQLDELFGVTHTKQGIRPTDNVRRILSADLTAVARTLNRRARQAHFALAMTRDEKVAETRASARDQFLRPPVGNAPPTVPATQEENGYQYRICLEETWERDFCRVDENGGEVLLIINTQHEFYRTVYGPLRDADDSAASVRIGLEMFLLALARAMILNGDEAQQQTIREFVEQWSRSAAVFCRPAGGKY